jgi:hypothetical protein
MAARYVRRAVDAVADYIEANLPTYLDTVETEESLTPGSLEDPKDYLQDDAPHDNRSPLVQVFADSWDFKDQRQKILEVKVTIAVALSGNAATESLSAKVDRYVSALIMCLTASPSLGGRVNTSLLGAGDRDADHGDQSIRRQVFLQDLNVTVSEAT